MKILVVAATEPEIAPLKAQLAEQVDFLITGVGMVATAFALGRRLATHTYNLVINLGIAGSFDRSIELGDVVEITDDVFSELGAEDDERFITIQDLGFGESRFAATAALSDYPDTASLRKVNAITVNTVHGNEQSIARVAGRLSAQLESMEGAAFFYACQQVKVPGLQIRAVSNYVEKRNRDNWKIGLAVKNLNTFAVELLMRIVNCER